MTLASYVSLDKTFFLHSNPSSTKTIFLDFDGHITTNSLWNRVGNMMRGSVVTKPFNSDKNPNAFSNAELERIQYIWQRVAEDFAPFNIDVTTQDPGEAALDNTGGSDTRWGVRVAIGGSYSDWYKSPAGGVAYYGSFGKTFLGPVFVFTGSLGQGNEKYTAEAISHEAGHALGLSHDGTAASAYYRGHGNWAPIMGTAYHKGISQWSQGEFLESRNPQDDVGTISRPFNGAGYRADDFGNTAANATALTGPNLNRFGIISTRDDSDWFSFTTGAGAVSLSVGNVCQAWVNNGSGNYTSTILAGRSPNLDIIASLFTSTGSPVATSNPLNGLAASLNLTLAAGTYFLKVDGVGFGDPVRNGYSDYGSLGQYLVTGTIV
jgi:hypothetical protein